MTDPLTKAKELIERFDGKITQGDWKQLVIDGNKHDIFIEMKEGGEKRSNDFDYDFWCQSPTMLTIIKELVGVYEKSIQDIMWLQNYSTSGFSYEIARKKIRKEFEQENQALKQRIAELEGKG